MSNTTDQLGKQAREVTEDLQEMGRGCKGRCPGEAGQVGEKAAEYCEQAQDKVHGIACLCEQYVRERPLRSVLMAAGIGWLLGRFWKGR